MSKTAVKDSAIKAASKAAKKTGSIHLFILMDESGSMSHLRESVVTGCNEFLHSFKEHDDCRAWIAMFDKHPGSDRTRFQMKGKKISRVSEMEIGHYNPRGMTPLNDAILDSLAALDEKVGKDETVFMAIITDGMENASEATSKTVKSTIKKYEKRGWGFVYLGANQDSGIASAAIGLGAEGQSFNFTASKKGTSNTLRSASRYAGAHANLYRSGAKGSDLFESSNALRATEHRATGGIIPEDDSSDEEK